MTAAATLDADGAHEVLAGRLEFNIEDEDDADEQGATEEHAASASETRTKAHAS